MQFEFERTFDQATMRAGLKIIWKPGELLTREEAEALQEAAVGETVSRMADVIVEEAREQLLATLDLPELCRMVAAELAGRFVDHFLGSDRRAGT